MKHRFNAITPTAWLVACVVALTFSVGWPIYLNERSEQSYQRDLKAEREKREKVAETVAVLEDFVTVSRKQIEACQRRPKHCEDPIAPPVDEIEPEVIRAPDITRTQVAAATLALLPGVLADNCGGSCKAETPPAPKDGKDGADGIDGTDGAPGTPGADGASGKDAPIIVSITCTGMDAPAEFTFRFSDDTEIVAQCEMLPPVEEDP